MELFTVVADVQQQQFMTQRQRAVFESELIYIFDEFKKLQTQKRLRNNINI
jgi:hypothetical protein